jgi:cell cycle checkpoint protein
MRVKDLERIVSFQGINSVGADEEEGADGADEESNNALAATESWATDKPIEEGTPRKRRGLGAILDGRTGKGKSEGEELSSLPMQSLVISDDDIEDD